jgi:hypothetical protein
VERLSVDREVPLQQLREFPVQDVFGCGAILQQGHGVGQQHWAVLLVERSNLFSIELGDAHIWSGICIYPLDTAGRDICLLRLRESLNV